ncbi:hypothetical protein niasHS_004746 [Heterodera schachtii]|uniref:Uncharacterized protein n=1 Tax=Heterodera schachtii TaxID=97005 RepID=A0ABD2JTF1_HETSC
MSIKYLFVFLVFNIPEVFLQKAFDDKWLEQTVAKIIKEKIPNDKNVPKLCDFSIESGTDPKAADGEKFINYTTIFWSYNHKEQKNLTYPPLGEVARVGPKMAAKRFRHFGRAFPERMHNNKSLEKLYDAESGIMARETRWERNIYCTKCLAHMLQKTAERTLTASVVGVKSINYEQKSISVKTNIEELANDVNKSRDKIRKFLNEELPKGANNKLIDNKQYEEIKKMRKELADAIDKVAEEEGKDGNTKSSTMDMIIEFKYVVKMQGKKDSPNEVKVRISSFGKKWDIENDHSRNGTDSNVEPSVMPKSIDGTF